MSELTEDLADRIGASVSDVLRARLAQLEADGLLAATDMSTLAASSIAAVTDVALAELQQATAGTSALARRIGPIYTIDDLTRWLPGRGAPALSGEAVRKRATKRQLVGFRTDEGHWAFPAWQFDRLAGRLVGRDDVVAVWRALPIDGFLSEVDLAAWMATRLAALEGTPAEHAHRHGASSAPLRAAMARLTARAA